MIVLLVDDSQANLVLLKALVSKLEECEVLTYTSSREALAWCRDHDPDLVLVDYMMPEMNGEEFIAGFRALPGKPTIPVVMITANHDDELCARVLDLGASDFLNKPFNKTIFLAKARNLLAMRKLFKAALQRSSRFMDEVKKALSESAMREQETVLRLVRVAEQFDPAIGLHPVRVGLFSRAIGERMGVAERDLELLVRAAPMHDIGKVATPADLRNHPELLDDEVPYFREHTTLGHELLKGGDSRVLYEAADIALYHHERYDGTGYPQGIKGARIPQAARIVAVADALDVWTSTRPYRAAISWDEALVKLRSEAGKAYDPGVVDAACAMVDRLKAIAEQYHDQARGLWTSAD